MGFSICGLVRVIVSCQTERVWLARLLGSLVVNYYFLLLSLHGLITSVDRSWSPHECASMNHSNIFFLLAV